MNGDAEQGPLRGHAVGRILEFVLCGYNARAHERDPTGGVPSETPLCPGRILSDSTISQPLCRS
jgi:hypothetical protein